MAIQISPTTNVLFTTLGILIGGAAGAKLGKASHRIAGILIGAAAGGLITGTGLYVATGGSAAGQLPPAPPAQPPQIPPGG